MPIRADDPSQPKPSAAEAKREKKRTPLAKLRDELRDDDVPRTGQAIASATDLTDLAAIERELWRVHRAAAILERPWDDPRAVSAVVTLAETLRRVLELTADERRVYALEVASLSADEREARRVATEREIEAALAGDAQPTAGPAACAVLRADLARAWDHLARGLRTPDEAVARARMAKALLGYAEADAARRLARLQAQRR